MAGNEEARLSVNAKALVRDNGKKLNDIELLLNKVLAAQVMMDEDVKKLEEGLSAYLEGMNRALTAAHEFRKNEAWTPKLINELRLFDEMARLHEAKWRKLDTLYAAIMGKILKIDIPSNETWSQRTARRESC